MLIKLRPLIYDPGFTAFCHASNCLKECHKVLKKWEQKKLNSTIKKMKSVAKEWKKGKCCKSESFITNVSCCLN